MEGADRKEQGKTGTLIPSDSGPGPGEPWGVSSLPVPPELQPRSLAWSLLWRKPFREALVATPCDIPMAPPASETVSKTTNPRPRPWPMSAVGHWQGM